MYAGIAMIVIGYIIFTLWAALVSPKNKGGKLHTAYLSLMSKFYRSQPSKDGLDKKSDRGEIT